MSKLEKIFKSQLLKLKLAERKKIVQKLQNFIDSTAEQSNDPLSKRIKKADEFVLSAFLSFSPEYLNKNISQIENLTLENRQSALIRIVSTKGEHVGYIPKTDFDELFEIAQEYSNLSLTDQKEFKESVLGKVISYGRKVSKFTHRQKVRD